MLTVDKFVVDTNVLISANGTDPLIPRQCVISCINKLDLIKNSGKVVIDDTWEVLTEYRNNVGSVNGGGVGTQFLLYIFSNQGNSNSVELGKITKNASGSYVEYPSDPVLAPFDPSDKKFVALCALDPQNSVIVQATDTDFWEYENPMARSGINISFICDPYINQLAHRKNMTQIP